MAKDTGGNVQSGDDLGGARTSPAGPQRPRKKRRWLRVLLTVVTLLIVALVILVALLPTLVSTTSVTQYTVAALNKQLSGQVNVHALNLSWRGPSVLDGVTVTDPQQRQVLRVGQVKINNGLWQLVRSPTTFGDINIDQPEIVLYLQQDRPASLVQAFESRQPSAVKAEPAAREAAGPLPQPKGQLIIRGGTVRVIRPDGQEVGVSRIEGQFALDTLDDIQAKLAGLLSTGGQFQADARIKNLAAGGKVDPDNATGQFLVRTQEPIKIGPLAALADQPGVDGTFQVNVQGQLDRGSLQADLKTQLAGFCMRPAKGDPQVQPHPVDLALTGQISGKIQEQIRGRFDLAGGAGTASLQFAYAASTQPVAGDAAEAAPTPAKLTGQDLVALLLTGKPVILPNVQASAEANLDVHALAAAVPQLLQTQQGVQITGAVVSVSNLQVRTQPCACGRRHNRGQERLRDAQRQATRRPADLAAHRQPRSARAGASGRAGPAAIELRPGERPGQPGEPAGPVPGGPGTLRSADSPTG